MRLLLDTHALLWWLADDPQLGARSRSLIENSEHEVLVSVVSLWEIVVKQHVGTLQADVREVAEAASAQGFELLGLHLQNLQVLQDLPSHHRDPFDQLLIAQAIVEQAVFMTADQQAGRYPAELVNAVTYRRGSDRLGPLPFSRAVSSGPQPRRCGGRDQPRAIDIRKRTGSSWQVVRGNRTKVALEGSAEDG
ncbi:type II toxin-antitoxin system VapC family toxin [Teichococcus vastitatis]|uniref:type II toxin-antitoxin system VapC family toxin n=1 Tax=Teichococcus vastitatis TaxID=2307076 RepID=UPI000E739E72|nr:type II toxin-antitoxin system VapC family toxin [Pseudoroseomonas vastitatis]